MWYFYVLRSTNTVYDHPNTMFVNHSLSMSELSADALSSLGCMSQCLSHIINSILYLFGLLKFALSV